MPPPKKELQLQAALTLHQQGWPLSHIIIVTRLSSESIHSVINNQSNKYTNTPAAPQEFQPNIPTHVPDDSLSDCLTAITVLRPSAETPQEYRTQPESTQDGGDFTSHAHTKGEKAPLDDILPDDIFQRSPAVQSKVHKAHLSLVRDLRIRVTQLVADLRREGGGGGRVSPAETVGKLVAAVDKLIERERQLVGLDTLTAQAAPKVLHLVAKVSGGDGAGPDLWGALASAYADGAEIVTAVEDRAEKN